MSEKSENLQRWRQENPERVVGHQQTYYGKNRHRLIAASRKYSSENKVKLARQARDRRLNRTPDEKLLDQNRRREAALQRRYGISSAQYDAMLVNQGGHCALCPRTPAFEKYRRLNVDHDHDTDRVRGLLCTPCNHAVGILGDNADGLRRALAYVVGE